MSLSKSRLTTGRYRSDSIRSSAKNPILKTLLGAMTLLNLISCGSKVDPIYSIATMNTDQLQSQYIDYLCQAYGQGQYENVRVELIRREAFTSEEWKMIEGHQIRVGMSECGLLASWGGPGVYVTRSRTMHSLETMTDWTFQECPTCKARHVTTRDGKIIQWEP